MADQQATSSKPEPLTGGEYLRWGWHALSRDPFLPLFEACAAVFSYLVAPAAFITGWWLMSQRFRRLIAGGAEPLALLGRMATSPLFWLGLFGIGAVVWVVQFCLTAAVTGGTRGAAAKSVLGEDFEPLTTFWEGLPGWFPVMIGFRLFRGIAVGVAALIAGAVAVALVASMMDPSGPGGWPMILQALWLAAPMTLALALVILVRVGFDCAVGPIFCGDDSVPEGIAEGVRFFAHRFGLVYRIIAAAAIVLMAPLFAALVVSVIGALLPLNGPLASVGFTLRLLTQGLLIMTIPVFGLLLSCALMAAWHHLEADGAIPAALGNPERR